MDEVNFWLTDLKSRFDGIDKSKYYLSYSGGRDSHFLYWFIKEYLHDTEIEIVSVNTYMEHDEIRKRIYDNADVVLLPKMKPFEIKEKYGSPCFSKIKDEYIERYQRGSRSENTMNAVMGRNIKFNLNKKEREMLLSGDLHKISNKCCKIIKKDTMKRYSKESGKKAIMGVLGSESMLRKSQYKSCFTKNGNFTPLHDWTDDMIKRVEMEYHIEIPEIYNHIDRTGCMGCPYGHHGHNVEIELSLLNKSRRKFVTDLFKKSYDALGVDYAN